MSLNDQPALEPHQRTIQTAWLWMMRGRTNYAKDALARLTEPQLDEAAATEPALVRICNQIRLERLRCGPQPNPAT